MTVEVAEFWDGWLPTQAEMRRCKQQGTDKVQQQSLGEGGPTLGVVSRLLVLLANISGAGQQTARRPSSSSISSSTRKDVQLPRQRRWGWVKEVPSDFKGDGRARREKRTAARKPHTVGLDEKVPSTSQYEQKTVLNWSFAGSSHDPPKAYRQGPRKPSNIYGWTDSGAHDSTTPRFLASHSDA
ncbi:hypothetical protein G7046_g5459 [Stylonectria norvegica]|nr:hypothetical protein G7046_g5459 [Stylonectria norvegica]